MRANRPVVIERRDGHGPAGKLAEFPRPSPPLLWLSFAEAQARVPFQVRSIDDPDALLLSCAFFPSIQRESRQSVATARGTVHLDYMVEGVRLSLNQLLDDDVDGPMHFVLKPGAARWTVETIAGCEYVVLRTHDGRRFSSVNWKATDGVICRLEPRDMASGLDGSLLTRILEQLG